LEHSLKEVTLQPSNKIIIPANELQIRLQGLQQALARQKLDGALIIQKADLYYFSGTIQQGCLYVPKRGNPILMIQKSYHRACRESALDAVVAIRRLSEIPGIIAANSLAKPRRLGLELDVLPVNYYRNLSKIFPDAQTDDISMAIRMQRALKSDYEIKAMRQAASLADQLMACLPNIIEEGMPEIELAGRLEAEARKMGHQGIVRMRMWGSELFYGHLMAGPSAAEPSYLSSPTGGSAVSPAVAQGPGFRRIKANEPILFDYVFVWNGYLADETRIFSIGTLPDDLHKAYDAMCRLQQEIQAAAVPGVASGDLYQTAIERVAALGYADHFMGAGRQRIRFVGHGVGLELDEFPFLAQGQSLKLQEGMTIALEPKLIFPHIGVVGIENTHVVTPGGLMSLTQADEKITIV
jgi:Xaa-Pro aminopeptidase